MVSNSFGKKVPSSTWYFPAFQNKKRYEHEEESNLILQVIIETGVIYLQILKLVTKSKSTRGVMQTKLRSVITESEQLLIPILLLSNLYLLWNVDGALDQERGVALVSF